MATVVRDDLLRMTGQLLHAAGSVATTVRETRKFLQDGLVANANLRVGTLLEELDTAISLARALEDYVERNVPGTLERRIGPAPLREQRGFR